MAEAACLPQVEHAAARLFFLVQYLRDAPQSNCVVDWHRVLLCVGQDQRDSERHVALRVVILRGLLARLHLLEAELVLLLICGLPSNHHRQRATVLLVALRF